MAVADKIRKLHNTDQAIEPGPGCVGFWVDSENRLKFKDDAGTIYTVYDPTGAANLPATRRLTGTFASADTLSFTFTRTVAVTVAGTTITFASGALGPADVGQIVSWTGFSGIILSVDSATTATVARISGAPHTSGAFTATVGQNQDDTLYKITAIEGEGVLEIFGSGNKSTSGFDVYSSNATSTAVVTVTVVR